MEIEQIQKDPIKIVEPHDKISIKTEEGWLEFTIAKEIPGGRMELFGVRYESKGGHRVRIAPEFSFYVNEDGDIVLGTTTQNLEEKELFMLGIRLYPTPGEPMICRIVSQDGTVIESELSNVDDPDSVCSQLWNGDNEEGCLFLGPPDAEVLSQLDFYFKPKIIAFPKRDQKEELG